MAKWKHPVGGHVNAQGKTAAQVVQEAREAEERKRLQTQQNARDAVRPDTGKDELRIPTYGSPQVTGLSTGGGNRSSSVQRSYDYTGMDEAAKVTQALQAAEGSFIDVALSDPMKLPTLQNSIRSMQQYLAAYNSGQGLPPVRVSSESVQGSSTPRSSNTSIGQKLIGEQRITGDENDNRLQKQPPQPPIDPEADKPPGNHQVGPDPDRHLNNADRVFDDAFGIPRNVDLNSDPMDQPVDNSKPGVPGPGKLKTRQPKQGPPLPGLQHSASIWDLDYYV